MSACSQLTPAAFGLIGTLVGAAASLLGQYLNRRYEAKQKRTAIAHALAAEIDAYLDIIDRRKWVKHAERQALLGESGILPAFDGWLTEQEQSRDPFPIFSANMANIGLLGPSCSQIGRFYTSVVAIRTTVSQLQAGFYNDIRPEEIGKIVRDEIDFWLETVILGKRLIEQLRAL